MTGSLQAKTSSSGKSYFYIRLSYKDPLTQRWKTKVVATGLEVKNNKRRAEAMIPDFVEQYSNLERLPETEGTSADPDVTLCDYLDAWIAGKRRDLKLSTYEAYAYRVNCMKNYFSAQNPKIRDITPKLLDVYFKYLLRYGKTNQKTKAREPLAVRSVRSYKSILYAVFSEAVIDGLITANPAQDIRVHGKKNRDYGEEYLFLTETEISDLLHFLSEHYPRLLGIAFMGAYYGLRRSEILGLKWSAVSFEKKLLTIHHTVVRVKTTEAADATKTQAGKRSLYLFPTAESCLRRIKAEQDENRRFYRQSYQNTAGYVFTWEDGRAYSPDYISRLFQKAAAEFGRPEITLHKLRHSCASMLIEKGWNIKQLQYWLGHVDVQTTLNIYAHFNRQRLNASENDLSEISKAAANLFA